MAGDVPGWKGDRTKEPRAINTKTVQIPRWHGMTNNFFFSHEPAVRGEDLASLVSPVTVAILAILRYKV